MKGRRGGAWPLPFRSLLLRFPGGLGLALEFLQDRAHVVPLDRLLEDGAEIGSRQPVSTVEAHGLGRVDLLGLPLACGEPLQGQRYAPGQEFRPHTDTFNPGGYDYLVHTERGGQRSWTAMVYLNQPEDGGATRFKNIGKTIQPETGKLLAWNNLRDGQPNDATIHQGMKVRRGTKYIVTKWYRERPRLT